MNDALILNCKAYRDATDTSTKGLLDAIEDVAVPDGVDLIVAVNPVDLRLASSTELTVYAEHVDPVSYGSHTGSVVPESAARLGAAGTLLNHSECQRSVETTEEAVRRCQETGLDTVVCADSVDELKHRASIGADALAVEPPELIGGNTSVSTARPGLVEDAVAVGESYETPVLCGAGVKTAEDVSQAKDLGAAGVVLASGVIKAASPGQAVSRLLDGF